MKILMSVLKTALMKNMMLLRLKTWDGIKNGQLLLLLRENKFDAWIVVDKSIPYQQNLSNLPCLIIVLNIYRNTLKHLLPLIPKISEVLQKENNSKVVVIES